MPTLIRTLLLALCAAFLSACSDDDGGASAAFSDDTVRKLDAAVAERMQAEGLPGAVVAIFVPGEGDYVVARGSADLATGEARRVDQPFRIASITKTFIGTRILQLAEQGRLSVTDRLSKWYPAFPNADLITVDDLLRMRSGIADSAGTAFLAEYYAAPLAPITPEQMIQRAAALAPQFVAPGRRTVYTNVNFMLLEQIAVKVDGRDIGTQLQAGIFAPLGMAATSYPTGTALPGGLRGYSAEAGGALKDTTVLNPTPAGGAGAMISTVADLATYARAMCKAGLLQPAAQQARLRTDPLEDAPAFVGYGQGLVKFGRFCGHNGTIFGFSSEMWYLPEKDAVMVIDVNRLDADDHSKSTGLFLVLSKILFPDYVNW